MTHFCCHDVNVFCCSCPSVQDGPECDVIRIERYIRLMDDNDEIMRNMQNLHGLTVNMRHDTRPDGPIVPLLP